MRKYSRKDPLHTKVLQKIQTLSLNDILKSKQRSENTTKKYSRNRTQLKLNIKSIPSYHLKKTPFIIAAIVTIGAIAYLILYSNIFIVKNINILKTDNITNIEIAYKSVDSLRGKSIFSIDTPSTFKRISNYQNNVASISTRVIPPNNVKIIISSYKELFNTIINNKTYSITENGDLVPKKPSSDIPNLEVIFGSKIPAFLDYRSTFRPSHIQNIDEIHTQIKKNIRSIDIKQILYFMTERETHFILKDDSRLIFDLGESPIKQVEKLAIFHKESNPLQKQNIVYIDLRIKHKIHYCSIENKNQCLKNIKDVYQQ